MQSNNSVKTSRISRVRIHVGRSAGQRIAAIVMNGSTWFETGPTNATAVLRLLGRLESSGVIPRPLAT